MASKRGDALAGCSFRDAPPRDFFIRAPEGRAGSCVGEESVGWAQRRVRGKA